MEFEFTEDTNEEDVCQGLFWRGNINQFLSSKTIQFKKSLRFLKSKSCKGCPKCDWFWEFLIDDVYSVDDIIGNIKHGGLYTYQVNSSRDWETGICEIDSMEFVEVKEI